MTADRMTTADAGRLNGSGKNCTEERAHMAESTFTPGMQWRRVYDELHDTLVAEQMFRDRRRGMLGDELTWVVREREAMTDRVNAIRARYGQTGVTLAEVERAESMACGHSDYTSKFAIYCADLTLAAPVPHPAATDPSDGGGGRG